MGMQPLPESSAQSPHFDINEAVQKCPVDQYLKEKPLDRISTVRTVLYLIPVFGWIKYIFDRYESNKARKLAQDALLNDHDGIKAIALAHPLDKWRFKLLTAKHSIGHLEALGWLQDAQKEHPEIFEINFFKGVSEQNLGKYADAQKDFTAAEKIDKKELMEACKEKTLRILREEYPINKIPKALDRTSPKDLIKTIADFEILCDQGKPLAFDVATLKKLYFEYAKLLQEREDQAKANKAPLSIQTKGPMDNPKIWIQKLEALCNKPDNMDFEGAFLLERGYGLVNNPTKINEYRQKALESIISASPDQIFELAKTLEAEKSKGLLPATIKPEEYYDKAESTYNTWLYDNLVEYTIQQKIDMHYKLLELYQRPENKVGSYALQGNIKNLEQLYMESSPENQVLLKPLLFSCLVTMSTLKERLYERTNNKKLALESLTALINAQKYGTLSPKQLDRMETLAKIQR